MCSDSDRRWPWLLGLALALECAFFTHCYSVLLVVPFGIAELLRAVRTKRIDVQKWLALIIPPMIAVIAYVPLLRSYQSNLGPAFSARFLPNLLALFSFYPTMLDMTLLVVIFGIVLLSLERSGSLSSGSSEWSNSIPLSRSEIAVVFGFLSLPILGILLARLIHGPFFARYFTATIIAVCIAIGVGVGSRPKSRSSLLLTGLIVCLVLKSFFTLAWHRVRGVPEMLYEPSSGVRLNMDGANALQVHPLLRAGAALAGLPVLVPHMLDYNYLIHNAPVQARHFFTIGMFNKEEGLRGFLPTHRHFLVYAIANEECYRVLSDIMDRGGVLKSLKLDDFDHFLAEVQMMPSERPN